MQAKSPEPKLSAASAQVSSSCFRIDPLFQAPDATRVSGASVTFEPRQKTVVSVTERNAFPDFGVSS